MLMKKLKVANRLTQLISTILLKTKTIVPCVCVLGSETAPRFSYKWRHFPTNMTRVLGKSKQEVKCQQMNVKL